MKKVYVAMNIQTGKTLSGSSQKELADKIKVHRSNIGRAASGEYSQVRGYVVAAA